MVQTRPFLLGYLNVCNKKVFEKEKIQSCLKTIFEFNVMKYGNGQQGAVNGMRPNGKIDKTSMQSEEMWIGVTDAFASLMVFEVSFKKFQKGLHFLFKKNSLKI